MRSRFIARMTDIAFQASPPRGVGMLRLVSPSAISRYGLPRIASTTGLRSSFGAGNVVCLSASWRAWSAGHRVSLRTPFAVTIRYRRRWSTGCGTCCSPDNTGDNNSVREITGGALQRLSDVKLIRGSFEDAPVGDLADQGPNGD